MSRIGLEDTARSAIIKMADGNPRALSAMFAMLENGQRIDPQGIMGGLGAILLLDTLGIYGTGICVLFNDQCNRDVRKLFVLLRAYQLGFLLDSLLQSIAACQTGENLLSDEEMQKLDEKVCKRLKKFEKPNPTLREK